MHEIITERPNLFEPDDYITFYIELSGKVRAEELADAIKSAYRANEATMSKVVLEPDGVAYYEETHQSGCKVEIAQNDWQEVIRQNEKIPFELEHGELIRCSIFPVGEKISFVIMAHHLAGDGKGITYFIEDIMEALSGAELEYKPLSLLSSQTVSKIGKYPFAVKMYIKFCNWKWRKIGNPSFSWDDYYNLHRNYWRTTSSYVQYKHFSKNETKLILDNAKRIGVSVNSYIITAFLQADSRNHIVGIPVSVRENGNKSMTNLTSGVQIIHSFADRDDFSENAKQVQQKVSKELEKNRWFVLRFLSNLSPTLIDGVLLYTHHCYANPLIKQLAKVMRYVGDNTRDLGITNLTVLDISAVYDTVKIEKIIFVPPNVSYSSNIIGVSTFNGEMTITYHGTEDKKEQQKRFFDRGVKNLLSYNIGI